MEGDSMRPMVGKSCGKAVIIDGVKRLEQPGNLGFVYRVKFATSRSLSNCDS